MKTSITRHPRVDVADALRGFAVLAIILLHSIEHFNYYTFPDPATQSTWLNFCDKAIWDGLFFLFGGKAYAIFALLFGFSFFIQHDNQRMTGRDFRLRFCWRLVLLFLIGCVNAAFFTGEILVMYSLVGFVLVLTCRLPTRWLVAIGALCMLQPVALYHTARSAADPAYVVPALDWVSCWQVTNQMQSGGTFLQMVKANLWEGQLFSLGWAWDHGRIFQTAGLFIFGMLVGRQGWFLRPQLHRWGWVLTGALIAFFPLHGLQGMMGNYITTPNVLSQLTIVVSSLANLAFMLILVSGILFGYYNSRKTAKMLSLLIPYGKLSMTNYVTQGIIGSAIFYNWGLHTSLCTTYSVMVGVAIFIVQYAFCRFWVGRHGHGPLEYMWKKATWI